ncbi:MAG: hypothetical protein Q9218_007060 [Villophora microphyllina]
MAPPFVYINGYPGVGKYTIAKELVKLLANAQLLDNHLLIDPVAALYERSMPEYQGLRKYVRKGLLDSIATSTSLKDVTWIFTDSQSSDAVGSAAVADYIHAAETRGSPIISIILNCTLEENCYRMNAESRGKTKLHDCEVLIEVRETEELYLFGGDREFPLNVTDLTAYAAARKIHDFIKKVTPKEDAKLVLGD